MRKQNDPIDDAAVMAIHPGGGALPPAPYLADSARLAAQEQRLLDLAIERHLHGSGEMADLAASITALRAAVRQ